MKTPKNDLCPLCSGTKTKGKTTFTVDLGFGVVVIRQVPAMVCNQCSSEWMDDKAAEKVENLVTNARNERNVTPHNSILLYRDISSYKSHSNIAVAKEPAVKYRKVKK